MKGLLSLYPSLGHLTTDEAFLVFSGQFFERLALCLRNQQGREDARQHEESEDLETIKNKKKPIWSATHPSNHDEGAELTCA